jgi:5'-nucleotidase
LKKKTKRKPLVLISNDDGIYSEGINALAAEVSRFAEVIVAAPHTQQSAVGHAVTISKPIRAAKINRNNKFFGYAVEGTPADSVKLAVRNLIKGRKIDLLISGINHGSNTAINIIYSGTVSAATEGTILGIPSIAVSLTSFIEKDFSVAAKFAARLGKVILKKGLPKGTLLNVNVPAIRSKDIQGVLITKQGNSFWDDFYDLRLDPNKREYYWLTGKMKVLDRSLEYDEAAVLNNYISVTPIHYDLTAYEMLDELKSWKL